MSSTETGAAGARTLRHFSREEIMAIDPVRVADTMAACLAMVSRGAAVAPIRGHIDLGDGAGTFLISGALTELDILTVKVINVRPRNPARAPPGVADRLRIKHGPATRHPRCARGDRGSDVCLQRSLAPPDGQGRRPCACHFRYGPTGGRPPEGDDG
jgi:hypothetical protein